MRTVLATSSLDSVQSLSLSSINWSALITEISKDFSKTREILKAAGLNSETLSTLSVAPESNVPYGRRILYKSENFEVMLATWAPHRECAPHNHGYSNGAVWLVKGSFIENHYNFKNTLIPTKIRLCREDSLLDVDSEDIHSMSTTGHGISLHIYSPPIHDMKVYDTHMQATLTVTDDCGAWVPMETSKIVGRVEWQNP